MERTGAERKRDSAPPQELFVQRPIIRWLEQTTPPLPPLPRRGMAMASMLLYGWAAGATVMLAILLIGWLRLVWIARQSDRVLLGNWSQHAAQICDDYGLRRTVRLIQTRRDGLLATWGILRPRIVLPLDADSWEKNRIEVVLRHELAHVRRNDWLIQMMCELLRVIYWFNPLIWMACSRLRRESEQAADDTVLNSGVAGGDYAAHLLDLARTFRKTRYAWSPALLMARESTLEQRFKALLNPDLNRRSLTRFATTATILFFLAITMPVAMLQVSAQEILSLELPVRVLSAPLELMTRAVLPQNTAPTGSIEGIVVQLDTGEPLGDVHVELSMPVNQSPTRFVKTSGNGHFTFQNIPPGQYQIIAAREGGYLAAEFGQRTPSGRGLTIKLGTGQKMTGLRISMMQPGSISGRVIDRDGEPVGRAQVQALRTVYLDDQRSESIVASVATDDRGEYRLYWLPPGQYHISVTPQDIRRGWVPVIPKSLDQSPTFFTFLSPPVVTRRILESGATQEEMQVPTYFPGTSDLLSAPTIDVRSGGNVSGVDITPLPPARTFRVRGTLMNTATGRPAADGLIRAVPLANIGTVFGWSGTSSQDGKFDIAGVLPGKYLLTASAPSGDDRNALGGSATVTVGENGSENVVVGVSTGADIPVRVVIEGNPDGAGVSFRLRSVPAQSLFGAIASTRPGTPQRNLLTSQQFTLEGVRAGEYMLSFFAMGPGGPAAPMPVYVKSARMGDADVLNGPLHVSASIERPLEIVISGRVSTLEGIALNNSQEPVSNATVTVIPNAPYRGRSDLYKTGKTDMSGRFQIGGIAPGDYRVFCWDDVEGWPWQDPDWLRPYEGRGQTVHFGEGSTETVRIAVIR